MLSYSATKPAAGNSNFDHNNIAGEHSVISTVAKEHGPAISHIHFGDGSGAHHVISTHPDGHQHISTGHPNFGHALEHIGIAHGEQ